MLALIIGYPLTIVFVVNAILFLVGACRQIGPFGVVRAMLRLYGFAVFGILALISARIAGI